jgi:UDP-glucose 4-epimerase
MSIFVVGSCGYIGTMLSEYLRGTGFSVQGLSIADSPGIDSKTGVLSDDFELPPTTDTVIYLAQSPYYRDVPSMFWHLMNMNVVGAVRVAELSRRQNVEHFIYTSTGNVYSPSFQPLSERHALRRDDWYSLSKIHAEESLSLFRRDMHVSILRLFGVYGPGQKGKLIPRIMEMVMSGKTIFVEKNPDDPRDNDGLKISLCYIDDLLKIFHSVIRERDIPLMNVASDEILSIRKIAATMAELSGRGLSIEESASFRNTNFIADISLLKKRFDLGSTHFTDGIAKTILAAENG